jgi:hypothetical protein
MSRRDMAGIGATIMAVGLFFAASAVFMVLWNSVVMDAFAPGMITKVTYVQSLGLTLFVGMFIQAPRIVYDMSRIIHDDKIWRD